MLQSSSEFTGNGLVSKQSGTHSLQGPWGAGVRAVYLQESCLLVGWLASEIEKGGGGAQLYCTEGLESVVPSWMGHHAYLLGLLAQLQPVLRSSSEVTGNRNKIIQNEYLDT